MKVKFKFQKLSTILLIVDLTQEQQIFTYIRYHKTWDMMKIIIQKNSWQQLVTDQGVNYLTTD